MMKIWSRCDVGSHYALLCHVSERYHECFRRISIALKWLLVDCTGTLIGFPSSLFLPFFLSSYGSQNSESLTAHLLCNDRMPVTCLTVTRLSVTCLPITRLLQAKRRLTTAFAFVGLTDYYNESVCLFHAMFGGSPRWSPFLYPCNHVRKISTKLPNYQTTTKLLPTWPLRSCSTEELFGRLS